LFWQTDQAVITLDDGYAGFMIAGATCPIFTFSLENDSADLVAKRIKVYPDKVEFCALTLEHLQTIELNIPALFSVCNAMAALSACLKLGFELADLAEAMKTCAGVKGRVETVPTGRDFTVIIDYAHKPYALENIIKAFRNLRPAASVTLFAAAATATGTKRPLMGEIAARLSDFVVVTATTPGRKTRKNYRGYSFRHAEHENALRCH
jgi:UDP-N-acetylmuramoyl-L-alanyl-D-glutamate--2,6-diaminopimelate ligase